MYPILITSFFIILSDFGFSQNGKLLFKELIDISLSPYCYQFSENDILKTNYKQLNNLNFYASTYKSDNSIVKGITLPPKKEEVFPIVIFNRGDNANFTEFDVSSLIYFIGKVAELEEYGGKDLYDVLHLTKTITEVPMADTNIIRMFDKIKTTIVENGPSNSFDRAFLEKI